MKFFVTGVNGQLGHDVMNELNKRGHQGVGSDMADTEKYGYYHATNEGGYISWYDFCCEFYKQYGLKTRVVPVTTEEYGLSKAVRPVNSRLDKSKLIENGFEPLPTWQDAVRRYLEEAKL